MSPPPPDITISLDPAAVPLTQEVLASVTVKVSASEAPCEVQLRITGESAAWSWVTPGSLTLAAGMPGQAKAVFRAPRAGLPRAGPLSFGVEARVAGSAGPPTEARGTLEITPYADVFATMDPPASSGSRSGEHTLVLDNRGNAAMRATLTGSGDDLDISIDPPAVRADPGEQATATVTARAQGRAQRGAPRQLSFQVIAEVEDSSPVTVTATLRQSPARPIWTSPAAIAGAVVLAAGVVGAAVLGPSDDAGQDDLSGDIAAAESACPADGHIGSAVHGQSPGPAVAPGYTFLNADNDGCQPIRFNPCEPLGYVINDALAPPGGLADVQEAIARLGEATGMTFVDEGRSDEALDVRRSAYQPERYGERWAPILIGWSNMGAGQGPDIGGGDIIVAGQGNPLRVGDVFVSGILELNADVILNRETAERLPGGFGEGITRGRVMLHELGHVVGLGHPSSQAQLMYGELAEQTSGSARFGVGDRIGLRLVGREAGCLPTPPLPADE